MTDPFTIYRQHADLYEQLVAHEDFQQRLLPALSAIRTFGGVDLAEWGAGTGRLSALVAPQARSIIAMDVSPVMLKVAAAKLCQFENLRWQVVVADHRSIPLPDRCADVALGGWTLCYLTSKFCGETWQRQLTQAIEQMWRVLRPGGTIIIVETLGTGFTEPRPPARFLAEYYAFLESDLGFQTTWVHTDYQFTSLDEAVDLLGSFFGDELADQARQENWIITPECTGIWWKEK